LGGFLVVSGWIIAGVDPLKGDRLLTFDRRFSLFVQPLQEIFMRKRFLTFASILTGLLSGSAFAADKIPLRLALEPGMAWTFEQTQDNASDNKATANGQSQSFSTKMHGHRIGKIEVVAAKNGIPTTLKVTYGDGCETVNESGGQQFKPPFPYAGKTITITRADDGSITDDFNDQVDPQTMAELHEIVDQELVFFPKDPVAVGEEWPGDAPALGRALQLQGPNEQAGMTLKLLSVKEVDGRPTAEVKVSIAAVKEQQGIQVKVVSQGTALVDIHTGHAVQVDLKGTTTGSGDPSGPGPNGQQITYHIEGSGTLTSSETSKFISAGSAPTAVAITSGAPSAPADNPLAPSAPADPFAGTFSDGKLTVDWSAATADGYSGTLTLGDKKFQAKAQRIGQRLDGAFDSGGTKFPFSATLDGDTLNFVTGTKTYTLKKAAVNPLDAPSAPANPLAPGASTGGAGDALAAYTTVNATDAGKALSINRTDMNSVEAALTATYKDLAKYFDAAPTMRGAYEDQKDHRSAGASFIAKLKGQPVAGMINCKLGDNGMNVAVIYCRADAPREEWTKLAGTPQGGAAPGGAPGPIQLQTYTFPDGTGSIGLAQGWSTQAQSCMQLVVIQGPNDEGINMGLTFSVYTPDSPALRLQQQLAANSRRMGNAAPQGPQTFVAPFTEPVEAVKNLMPQLSAVSQRNGGPALEFDKALVVKPAQSMFPNGRSELMVYSFIKTRNGQSARYRAVAQVSVTALTQGSWMFSLVGGSAPEELFERDEPTILAMTNSLKTNDSVINQKSQQHLAAQNAWFQGEQRAHQQQVASFDEYMKDQEKNANIRDRSFADFDENIIGYRSVLDTSTGEKTSVDLGNVDGVVNKLNEGDPGRYQEIPLRDELFPAIQGNR
jgi:hypothetical protein